MGLCRPDAAYALLLGAAVELDRTKAFILDEGQRFPLCQPEPLRQLFQSAPHLGNMEVRSIDVTTPFHNFDDYWSPFLGGQGPAPSYAMSLSEEKRVALREHIRLTLPISPDVQFVSSLVLGPYVEYIWIRV